MAVVIVGRTDRAVEADGPGDVAVTESPGVVVEDVTSWMSESIDGITPPLEFQRIKGGHSNLTYEVRDAAGRKLVLRRPPLGDLLPTAHDMSREWRFISAIYPTGLPVPPPLAYCEDREVTGAPFYVMDFVEGHVLHDPSVAGEHLDAGARQRTGESFIDVLADLHTIDPDEVGLGDIARKEGYIARQLKRWYSQWEASKTRELPLVDEVHEELSRSIPEQGPARVVHGDYRLGNCITAPEGRIAAVLDWEIATLGDPMADVGYAISRWAGPGPSADRTDASAAPGFPSPDELLDRYAQSSGRDLAGVGYYIAFSHWKMACIVEGVYARYLAGALDSSGMDIEAFKLSVDHSAKAAARALES